MHINKKHKIKILISPLDWGLGHASRCIPIIQELINQDFEVFIASSGRAKLLLTDEFPELQHLDLPSYNITYPNSSFVIFHLLKILPRILKTINQEKKVLEDFRRKYNLQIVISDNRFGLFNKNIHTIFITHQTQILIPKAIQFLNFIPNFINNRNLNRFDEVWIPDFEIQKPIYRGN